MPNEFIARNGIIARADSVISGSLTVTGVVTGSFSGSFSGSATTASFANTASFINPLQQPVLITGSLEVTGSSNLGALSASNAVVFGDVQVLGTASINTLVVNQTQLSTGSNQLGDAANDTQTLYGSVIIPTGSLTVTGSVTSSQNILVNSINIGRGGTSGSIFQDYNIAIGNSNFSSSVPDRRNIAIGSTALRDLTTGYDNVAIGPAALPANTAGESNVAIGIDTLAKNTLGSYNLAMSQQALFNNTFGGYNIGIGWRALYENIDGEFNIGLGTFSLYGNKFGSYNIGIGDNTFSALNLSTGSYNTALGYEAASLLRSGSYNLYLGVSSNPILSGSSNTFIGSRISASVAGTNLLNNSVIIADGSGSVRFYSPSSTNVIIGGTTDLGYKLQVSGSGNFNNDLTTSGSFTAGVSSVGRYIGNVSDTSSINNGLTVRGDLVVAHTNILSQLVFGYTNSTKYLYVGTDGTGPYFKGTTVLDIRVVNGADVGLYVRSDNTAFFNSSNVSINGTTGLGEKTLQVNGSGRFTNTLSVTGSTDIRGSGTTSATAALTVNNSAASRVLTVLDNGRVGIGTTSPSASLQVGPVVDTFAVGVSLTGDQNLIARNTTTHHNWIPFTDGNNYFSAGSHTFRNQNMSGVGLYVTNTFTGVGTNVNSGYAFDVSGSGRFTSGLTVTGSAPSDGTGAVIIRNTTGAGNFRPALQLIQPSQMGWGIVMEIKGNGVDKSGLLFSNASTSNSWTIGQGVYAQTDNFAIGYRGGSVNSWATPYVVLTTGGNLGVGTSSPGFRLDVSGSSEFVGNVFITGSTFITASASTSSAALYIYKSGSTTVDVQGSQGQLFSITDSLTGSLMSVNDVSGLPILEVFSDDKVTMGTFGAPGLTVSGSLTTIATGSSAPTGTAPEGTFRFVTSGGSYFIYVYIGGAWRSGSLF